LTISLGLGTFLLLSLFLTREVLLAQFRSLDRNEQPNIFLFDIQPDQAEAVANLVRTLHFPIIQEAPIVTMRLVEIKGRKSAELLADPKRTIPEWAGSFSAAYLGRHGNLGSDGHSRATSRIRY